MLLKKRIGWDITHREFTIEDHYYFSYLKRNIIENGSVVSEVTEFCDLMDYDVIVFNYPEIVFSDDQIEEIHMYISEGKRVIITGYYNNEDKISTTVNSLAHRFGVRLNVDEVRDNVSNENGDDLLIVTEEILDFNDYVKKIMLPCSASITVYSKDAEPMILKKGSNGNRDSRMVVSTINRLGKGEFIVIGSCVFWDNFAIKKYNNLRFSLNLLLS